ncbi:MULTISPECIES: ATP-dependent DNA ligase [Streptomyces]|uniref:ATP-dependent DNA ligase n=1 Tax=Streptomyces TaxID=1883 RepID=UPI0029BE30B9|nr:ATP-dependent DNA ligase [Streptomyces stelliscabiei]MDX2514571.1 ATP-dependent DNA ligase [Streptomyces stelliscabiei]MDX2661131.1 ATP-dependent DNA ligase [Streptomyces stelliscabiei]MDX2790108.1 ATP-dependent DNA ligase [Streptomyces stelliscabiei]
MHYQTAPRRCDSVALTPPIQPMLAEARRQLPPDGALPGEWIAEQKADGFRAILFARPGLVMVQSRQGADLTPAFPEIAAAATALTEALVLDGELVVPHEGRLNFAELQRRARSRGHNAAQAAAERPAYLIVFDVLQRGDTELLNRSYGERRAILEGLFAHDVLAAPFTLCPATTDRATALDWLDPAWGAVGIEGVVVKGSKQPYLPGKRAWVKVRSRTTAEGIIGGVTGALASPATLLLARYDAVGTLRLIARTTPLTTAVRRDLARRLHPGGLDHPWHGRRFSAGWGTRGELDYHPVRPDLVAEFLADTAIDVGRYRHPVRFLRLRDDLAVQQVLPFGA